MILRHSRSVLPAIVRWSRTSRLYSVAAAPSEEPEADAGKLSPEEYLVPSARVHEPPRDLPDLDEIELTPENYSSIEAKLASTVLHGRGVFPAFKHPRTHGIPVAAIHFRSYISQLLPLATHFATHAAGALAIPVSKVVPLPTKRSLWTVLKGPFAHKKKQENFERKVHKRYIKAWDADPEVVERWVKYLRKHAIGGVGMRITIWERAPVGVGRMRLQSVRNELKKSQLTDPQKVKAMGEEIVRRELAAPTTEDAVVVQGLQKS